MWEIPSSARYGTCAARSSRVNVKESCTRYVLAGTESRSLIQSFALASPVPRHQPCGSFTRRADELARCDRDRPVTSALRNHLGQIRVVRMAGHQRARWVRFRYSRGTSDTPLSHAAGGGAAGSTWTRGLP